MEVDGKRVTAMLRNLETLYITFLNDAANGGREFFVFLQFFTYQICAQYFWLYVVIGPLEILMEFKISNFRANFSNWWLWYI